MKDVTTKKGLTYSKLFFLYYLKKLQVTPNCKLTDKKEERNFYERLSWVISKKKFFYFNIFSIKKSDFCFVIKYINIILGTFLSFLKNFIS